MDEEKARKILGDMIRSSDDCLHRGYFTSNSHIDWYPGISTVTLSGEFAPQELKALAWWMENKGEK